MKKNSTLTLFILITILYACSPSGTKTEKRSIKLENGYYFINGEKTFINALGYEIGARPGQHPYKDKKVLEIARMGNDLKVIKEADFNAIRTWSELTEQEVQLVQESGLMLVYGIWIEPHGNFADPQFIKAAKEQVHQVMEWSKKYDCIITYLIMNEPMAAHFHTVGAQATVDLWVSLRDIIHQEHPGIPVTISNNSAIGAYVNEDMFDVLGYNTYDYDDGIPNYTQTFPNHFPYLKKLNKSDKPLLVTEFGMSVSPIGYGMYGGNTRKDQARHIIENFRDLLDAGVAGICPFYYADGWWKADNPAQHDPYPEEWFGYWGYASDNDTIGHPRPIWYEFKEYNQALIAQPRNQTIYTQKVPLEVFLNGKINKLQVVYNDSIIFSKEVHGTYFSDVLSFAEETPTDRELVIEFYNSNNELVKYETILLLTSKDKVILPELSVTLSTSNFEDTKKLTATYQLENINTPFTLDETIYYIYAHHIVWESGDHFKKNINPTDSIIHFSDTYTIPNESLLLNVGAGIDIKLGKFVKRIHAEQFAYRGNWADAIKVN